MRFGILLAAASALALTATGVAAQAPRPAPAPVATAAPQPTAADYDRAVAEIERLVRDNYVDAALKPAVLAALAEGRRSGRYARADAPQTFAILVTEDLQRASHDGHMYINWRPEQHRALSAPRAPGAEAGESFWRERTRLENSGLTEQRILEGNVRYLKVGAFLWDEALSPRDYDAAMAFLKGGDAIVLDLRGNGGGSPDAVNYLASHFVAPATKLMTFVMPTGEEISTSKAVPAGRITGKPVYVLIDKGVASAGEEFALHVDKFRFGQLVGETTAGGGNRNDLYPVGPGFVLSVSTGLAKHGTDGAGWQGTGIRPALATPPERALTVAHARALQQLAESGPEARRADYAWAAEGLQAQGSPVTLSAAELARYAGTYGERTVRVADGALVYQRGAGPTLKLTPLGADRFGAENGDFRIQFEVQGDRAAAAAMRYRDGRSGRFERTA